MTIKPCHLSLICPQLKDTAKADLSTDNQRDKGMSKPFHYKVNAADFLAQVFQIPRGGHEAWLRTLALDLVRAEGSTEYAMSLINEVKEFRQRKAAAGRAGGLAKANGTKDRFSKS